MIYCEDCSSYDCGCPERKEIESLRQQLAELKGMREEVLHYQKEFHRTRDQLSESNSVIGLQANELARLVTDTESLRQQLAEQTNQVTMLRDALKDVLWDETWTRGVIATTSKFKAEEALAATEQKP